MIIRLFLIAFLCVISAFGNTVSLDASFNGTGFSILSVGSGSSLGDSLAIQTDGKIVIGGWKDENANDFNEYSIMRLNTDGTLDTTFGINGIATSPINGSSWAAKLLIQPDGKILLAANYESDFSESFSDFAVLRFTSNGEIDTTFNGSGYARVDINSVSIDICFGMALQPDGKIVLVGRTWKFGDKQYDMAAVRVNPDGSLDSTFDNDGILRIYSPDFDEEAYSVLMQTDGKIIIGGYRLSGFDRFMLTRLNPNGSPDMTFGNNGSTIYAINTIGNRVKSMAFQSDGKLLALGSGIITRFSESGVRDMTFGLNGVATTVTPRTSETETNEIRVLDNDKFVVVTRHGARRFMANGAVDTHFSRDFHPPNNNCYMKGISIQSDDKVLVGGYCYNTVDTTFRFAAYRFEETRTKRFLDFNGDESTDISIYRPSNGQWWYLENLFSQMVLGQFGSHADKPVPADFTGDGKTDLAVFRPSTGEWFVSRSENGSFYGFSFGRSEDIPIAADFDGDNIADPSVFRPSTNEWYIRKSNGGIHYEKFGLAGDKPVPADYDGDFKTDIAIFRPSDGTWWIHKSSDDNIYAVQFGTSTDIPVQGDYTGDNKTDSAFWRPSTGEWFILRSEDYSYYSIPFGLSDDLPAPGNFTGDGRYDIAVFRPSENRWHLLPAGGFYFYKDFGSAGDQILPNLVVP